MNLRAVRSPEGALELLGLLGYDRGLARPYDLSDLGWQGRGTRLLRDRSPTRGYGIVVAQTPELPRSLRSFGRRLVENFHDQPLALIGVGEPERPWREWVVVRPQLVRGGGGVVAIAKLQVDPSAPTAHDVEVLRGLSWHASIGDAANQEAISRALDVERVTRRFFVELNGHFDRIGTAVEALAVHRPEVRAGIDRAGGSGRVALRIVTQTLFCYFLQRKGLLEGNRRWLSNAYRRAMRQGGFYARVMEPLFYEALNTPVARRVEEWRRDGLPFLNGGLFERRYGDVSLNLDDNLFSVEEGLLGFLDGWSFTVSEDTADETEAAVDPEMLGKVFENLIADDERKAQGTIYTPRPVVQFMCREALVPYLQRTAEIEEATARTCSCPTTRSPPSVRRQAARRRCGLGVRSSAAFRTYACSTRRWAPARSCWGCSLRSCGCDGWRTSCSRAVSRATMNCTPGSCMPSSTGCSASTSIPRRSSCAGCACGCRC
jgi:hypothetical protein